MDTLCAPTDTQNILELIVGCMYVCMYGWMLHTIHEKTDISVYKVSYRTLVDIFHTTQSTMN